MQKIKELLNIASFILFPAKIATYFLALKTRERLFGKEGSAFDKPSKLRYTEEVMLDLICRANVEDSVLSRKLSAKLAQLAIDITIKSVFVMISSEAISMVFWVIAFNFPATLALIIVLVARLQEVVEIFIVIMIDLDKIFANGFFQKARYRALIANDELRKKTLEAIEGQKTFFNGQTFFRPELITGSYEYALNTVLALTRKSPSPPDDFFEEMHSTYFELEDKFKIIDWLNERAIYKQ